MLNASRYQHLLINEIAFRSGFADDATFGRMVARAWAMTAREMRQMSLKRRQGGTREEGGQVLVSGCQKGEAGLWEVPARPVSDRPATTLASR